MSEILMVLATLIVIIITARMIVKGVDPKLIFVGFGIFVLFIITAITRVSILGDASTGNIFIDVFDIFRVKSIDVIKGTGIRLMVVASYVMLMNNIKASNVLAKGAGKYLVKLRNPYLILSGVFILGSILKVFITSQISLGLLFIATLYPILIELGISKESVGAILISVGMLDMGPNDSSSIFAATEIMGIPVMDYFLSYEAKVGAIIIIFLAIFYPIYFSYLDKKDRANNKLSSSNLDIEEEDISDVPKFYGLFPLIPLTLVVGFSFSDTINLDIITANVISFAIVFICEYIRKRDIKVLSDHLAFAFTAMGTYFTNIVTIIIAAGIFSDAIKHLNGITIIANKLGEMQGGALLSIVALSAVIFGTALLTGSGNAPWYAFGPLIPDIASSLGIQQAMMVVPMHLAGGIGRSISPFCGGVIAISGAIDLDSKSAIKRNLLPLGLAFAINIIASYLMFI